MVDELVIYALIRTSLMNELGCQKIAAGAIARVIMNNLQAAGFTIGEINGTD